MNYRHIYMIIITKAKMEMKAGLRTKKNGKYYENHHILPRSLFPLWKDKTSNQVLLTAREHCFRHQLLTKIWPGQKMSFALAAFLWGYNSSNKQGIQRVNKYKITSREYERIRQQLSEESSIMQKEKWANNFVLFNELLFLQQGCLQSESPESVLLSGLPFFHS